MLTKKELNDLGFHRSTTHKQMFYGRGYEIWTLETEPGDTYVKVAIRKDNDDGRPLDYTYLNNIDSLEYWLERNEPKNTVHIEELEGAWNAPFPAPPNYNDELYHAPDTGVWGGEC